MLVQRALSSKGEGPAVPADIFGGIVPGKDLPNIEVVLSSMLSDMRPKVRLNDRQGKPPPQPLLVQAPVSSSLSLPGVPSAARPRTPHAHTCPLPMPFWQHRQFGIDLPRPATRRSSHSPHRPSRGPLGASGPPPQAEWVEPLEVDGDELAASLTDFLRLAEWRNGKIMEDDSVDHVFAALRRDLDTLHEQRNTDLAMLVAALHSNGGVAPEGPIVHRAAPHIAMSANVQAHLATVCPEVYAALPALLRLELSSDDTVLPEDLNMVAEVYALLPLDLRESSEIYSPVSRRLSGTPPLAALQSFGCEVCVTRLRLSSPQPLVLQHTFVRALQDTYASKLSDAEIDARFVDVVDVRAGVMAAHPELSDAEIDAQLIMMVQALLVDASLSMEDCVIEAVFDADGNQVTGRLDDRDAVVAVKAELACLHPQLQSCFAQPLGGLDTGLYVYMAAKWHPMIDELGGYLTDSLDAEALANPEALATVVRGVAWHRPSIYTSLLYFCRSTVLTSFTSFWSRYNIHRSTVGWVCLSQPSSRCQLLGRLPRRATGTRWPGSWPAYCPTCNWLRIGRSPG